MPAEDKKERILQSIDGIKKIPAPDFFYMRLRARMEKGLNNEKPVFILLHPSLLAASITFIIIINSLVLINQHHAPAISNPGKNDATIESFENDYNLSGTSQLYE